MTALGQIVRAIAITTISFTMTSAARSLVAVGLCGSLSATLSVTSPPSVHVVQNLTNNQFLELRDEYLLELTCVDVAEEVVCANLASLALEENLYHFVSRVASHDHIISLVTLEFELFNEVFEGQNEV